MIQKQNKISQTGLMMGGLLFMNAVILNAAITESEQYYWGLLVSVPLLFIALVTNALK